ncbi:MAG: ATP-binding protein [Bryobacterales bacterium]|nr:ATP-binding protein [Bryobacterales bacterium]
MSGLVAIRRADAPAVKELAVISGKGGTGKTSLTASFAALCQSAALADCDVDAADLHLVLAPRVVRREPFSGGNRARIRAGHCTACGKCEELCRFDAIYFDGAGNGVLERTFRVDPAVCEGCGVCAWFCAEGAIEFGPAVNGEWFISETRCGPMVHARLGVGGENSGKLVSTVRAGARRIAEERGLDLVLIDGSPGIGCPVIASITGASLVLAVTEPTLSGLHDLERVAQLTRHFGIPTMVCVNKWDLNAEVCERIEARAREMGLAPAGRVRYGSEITEAQIRGKAVVEYRRDGCASDIRAVWANIEAALEAPASGPLQGSAYANSRA